MMIIIIIIIIIISSSSSSSSSSNTSRKFTLEQTTKAQRGSGYVDLTFLTSALDGGWWSTPCFGLFTTGKDWFPYYRRLGGPQDGSERVRKISPPGSTSSIHAKFIGHKEKLRTVSKLVTVDKNSYVCSLPSYQISLAYFSCS